MLTVQAVKQAIMHWPSLYETEDGRRVLGCPVSQIPTQLRNVGWRNVSRLDSYDLQKLGVEVVRARYIGGARPKRFCEVAVAENR